MDEKQSETYLPGPPGAGVPSENATVAAASEIAHRGQQEVRRLGSVLRERVLNEADRRRETFARELQNLSEQIGPKEDGAAGGFAAEASQMVRRVADRLEEYDAEGLIDLMDRRLRERPGTFLVGGLLAGFFIARALRS